jgi:hypothetical protein
MGAPNATTTEVLVNTTATRLDSSQPVGRDGISAFNNSAADIAVFATTSDSPSFTIDTGVRVGAGKTWGPYPFGPEVRVYAIAPALQSTGAATIVVQYGG